jgi:hypothetical protein
MNLDDIERAIGLLDKASKLESIEARTAMERAILATISPLPDILTRVERRQREPGPTPEAERIYRDLKPERVNDD